jgi:modulator of FtsH protease HflC
MKNPVFTRTVVAASVIVLLLLFMTAYQVRQDENVVLTRFGQPVRVIQQAGLYFKWPWPIEAVNRLDARLNFYDIRISEALTKDKRNIIVLAFVVWKIAEPLKFLEAMGSAENAQNKLDSLIGSAKNTILGTYDFNQLISVNPDDVKLDEIERRIKDATAPQAANSFGVNIEEIGIKRLTLPEVNTRYVFERMRAERSQFAERYRAEGRQQADEITAKTDAEKTVILAKAQREAEETRGQAEADAARIYANAHHQAPDFYKFLRGVEALEKIINQNTTLVIDANTPPFDLLKSPLPDGEGRPAADRP